MRKSTGEWGAEYHGNLVKVLKDRIQGYEWTILKAEKGSKCELYAKMIPVIQSSGMGKSRLINELSKEILSVSFVLRKNEESGYPPGDTEITEFLTLGAPGNEHSRIVALFAGAIKQCEPPFHPHFFKFTNFS